MTQFLRPQTHPIIISDLLPEVSEAVYAYKHLHITLYKLKPYDTLDQTICKYVVYIV